MGEPAGVMTGRCSALGFGGQGQMVAVLLTAWLAGAGPARAAQSFGDIDVTPQPSHDGATHHGYREFRVRLENKSAIATRRVTLALPDRAYGWGNSLRRMQRTTGLGPGAQAEVSLWQPPLPMWNGGGMEVMVDGESLGSANVPNAQRHFAPGSVRGPSGQIAPVTFLVGRGCDDDEFRRSLRGGKVAPLSADMATGTPDAGTSRGIHPNTWMADPSKPGPHWIELDYATPMSAGVIEIHENTGNLDGTGGSLVLKGVSGTNLVTVPIPSTGVRPMGVLRMPTLVRVPPTSEPVQSIRIEFPPGHMIFIDAVGVSGWDGAGPTDIAWATAARASSEASGTAGAYLGTIPQEPRQFLRAELPVSEWSGQWLSYTPYDAIVLGRADQSLLTGAVAAALRGYVEAGGNLILFGNPEAKERWQGDNAAVAIGNGHRIDLGFGHCFVLEAEKPSELADAAAEAILEAANSSARFWQALPTDEGANSLFPVVENVAVPVRGIVLAMLGFILLIGPVNLIVLSRLKRRTWMLWTIPAISMATCGLVFIYSFVREGFTPDCRLESLTYLDQANRRAASIGAVAFYCPLTPSVGLRFTSDTEATPLVQTWDQPSGAQRELDWTQDQHLQRGWVTARVPSHFCLRKAEPRRERLQLTNVDGALEVINGLGATVVSLLLSDAGGRLHRASRIAAGQKAVLSPATEPLPAGEGRALSTLFLQAGYAGQIHTLSTNAAAYLSPGTYLAELDGSPFLESGFGDRSARTRTRAYVYGVLDRGGMP